MWISAKVTHLAEMGRVKVPFICRSGGMADALASGASDRKVVWVQVPSPAPKSSYLRAFFFCPLTAVTAALEGKEQPLS